LASVAIPELPLDLDERFEILRTWQRVLYDAGYMGIHWPERFGGRGLTPRHHVVFYEELARAGAPPPVGNVGLDVVGPSIVAYGTDQQRDRIIPAMLSGEEIWSQGFSEPEAGSDLASLSTRGIVATDTVRLTGQKVWTTWGHKADWCAVLARTDPEAPAHQGISYLLVDMRSPGIDVRPLVQINGDAEFSEVFFDGVEVPIDNLLGEPGQGWAIAMHTLGQERGGYALRRHAELEVAFRRLVEELRAGGSGFSEVELEALGRSYTILQALRAQTQRTLERLSSETGPSPVDSMDKLLLTEVEQAFNAAAFDLLGPFRMATGSRYRGLDVDRLIHGYLSSRAVSIYGGTSQIQRDIVAKRQLGLVPERRS
jgi:alkylation response protein AidB-like acyl-CoA dehydrogenase